MRTLATLALVLTASSGASAQTTHPVDVAIGYRFVAAEVSSRSSSPTTSALPLGFDVAVTARVAPAASLVGQFGVSSSSKISELTGGITGLNNPSATGTVQATVWDLMGGVKFSGASSGFFVQALAGTSKGDTIFQDVSGAGQSGIHLDQGSHRNLALSADIGFDVRPANGPVGLRVKLGLDQIFGSSSTVSSTTSHVHFGIAAVFGGR